MRIIVIILLAMVAFSIYAYDLENDTIYCVNSHVILSLPRSSIKRVQIDQYEEGFFRIYTLIYPGRSSYAPYIVLHYGALAELSLPQPDNIIYNCKLGNVVNSIYFTSDGEYFRRDIYNVYGIKVVFGNVAEDDLELTNYILDNLKIYHLPK